MRGEIAMQFALLLGRYKESLREQISLLSEVDEESFSLGWALSLQEESLRSSLLAINKFLVREGEVPLPAPRIYPGSAPEWQETLWVRYREAEGLYEKVRILGIQSEGGGDIFSDL